MAKSIAFIPPQISWAKENVMEYEKIKNERSVNEVVAVLNRISGYLSAKSTPEALLKKNGKLKMSNEENK